MNPLIDIGLAHYLVLSAVLFSTGVAAVIMRRNAVVVLMGLELILNAASLNFVALARFGDTAQNPLSPHVVVIFLITLAAAEAAVALAIVLNVYNRFGTITVDEVDQLKE